MKVTNTTPNFINKNYGNQPNKPVSDNTGKLEKPGKENSSDNVSLSGRTQDLQKAEAAMDSLPPGRTEKVAALKKSVEEGTYTVNAEKVAEKMAGNFLQELI